jgi:hypothetical protein
MVDNLAGATTYAQKKTERPLNITQQEFEEVPAKAAS